MPRETSAAIIEFEPDGIVLATAKPVAQDRAEAQEFVDAIKRIHAARGHRVRLLVDMRATRSLSRAARLVYQSDDYAESLVCTALMSDSGISRVIGNFVLGLYEGKAPTRLFSSFDDARAWLRSMPGDE